MSSTLPYAGLTTQQDSVEPSGVTALVAVPEEAWKEAAEHAWNDDTLDFLLNQWDQHADLWEEFSVVYGAAARDNKWLSTQSDPQAPFIFALRAVYERTFGERITAEQVSTLAVQKRLWQVHTTSQLPATFWEHLALDEGVADELLELLWTKSLRTSQTTSQAPKGKKRRLGFQPQYDSLAYSLLRSKNLTDEQVFKWLVRVADKNAPHNDTRALHRLIGAVIDNPVVSRRTLRTALRITLRAIPADNHPEHDHRYQVCRRLIFDALQHPQMDYSLLEGFRDAGLIDQTDYEGYVDELATCLYEEETEPAPVFVPPEGGSVCLVDSHIANLPEEIATFDNRLDILESIPEGFPFPEEVWDKVAEKLEANAGINFQRTEQILTNVDRMLTKRPAPPKEVILRSLHATMAMEPVTSMLFYYGYAAKQFRDQARADGMDADNLPLEWIIQVYA